MYITVHLTPSFGCSTNTPYLASSCNLIPCSLLHISNGTAFLLSRLFLRPRKNPFFFHLPIPAPFQSIRRSHMFYISFHCSPQPLPVLQFKPYKYSHTWSYFKDLLSFPTLLTDPFSEICSSYNTQDDLLKIDIATCLL